ncbi:hypothetical protein BDV33DRAFT_194184 [Aspergillus novoparasiticus]|uniref:DUF7791 domain-containing protein n=1 Tax=Aspergillus novoparasiticus TaxID=986946 RepID=A0A5N6EGE5_9EURO|nr:hypothetical protein BDV33DRAFT_194184 [Aspergillus novoparasiticus]
MKKDRNFERIKESYHELAENIVLRADGVFLWARLATRSFLGGVGYRDSPQTLRKKLAAIPEDMKTLFDSMLGGVDSSAREEADKLLLIASELPYPYIPAVLFSWLDDLHDVTFPYRVLATGYSEKYLKNRVDIVRSKIDSLSKGLLELHTESATEGCGKYRVMFFHRTARDYLRDSKVNHLRNRLPNFDVQDSCCRLLLAYCIFSSMEYDRGRIFDIKLNIGFALAELFRRLSHSPTSSKIVAVFQHMWENSLFSHIPIKFYYSGRNSVALRTSHPKNRFHYWCWLLCHDQGKFVLDRLSASASLPKDPSFQKQLFLLAVAYGHRDVVRVLLQKGVSPSDNFTVELGKETKESPMSLWMITLTLCAQQMIDDANSGSAGILLELLSWSSELDHDAFFLVHLHHRAFIQMETLGPQQLKMVSLQQLLSLRDTPESRKLGSLITRRTQAHWWDRLMAGIRIGVTEYIASKQEGKSLKEGLCCLLDNLVTSRAYFAG